MVSMLTRQKCPGGKPSPAVAAPFSVPVKGIAGSGVPFSSLAKHSVVAQRPGEQRQPSSQKSLPGAQTSVDMESHKEWMNFLRSHCLLHVADSLLRNGFDDLETLAEMEDADVKDLFGISPHDGVRLRKAVQELRGKSSNVSDDHPVVAFLRECGLQQYAEVLIENGFDDMETLREIQDGDMRDLGFARGHALKLAKRVRELDYEAPRPLAAPVRRVAAAAAATPQAFSSSAAFSQAAPAMAAAPRGQHAGDRPRPRSKGPPSSGYFLQGPQASEDQKSAVQRSWALVQDLGSDVLGEKLYRHVFSVAPQTMELFPPEVRYKYREWSVDEGFEDEGDVLQSPALRKLFAKVVNAVGVSVAGLRQPAQMVPMLTQLGARHISYGVDESYWGVLGEGLILTLQECLGDAFTQEVQLAWTMVYGFISAVMIQGLKSAIQARDRALGDVQQQPSHVDDRSSVRSERSTHPEEDQVCPEKSG